MDRYAYLVAPISGYTWRVRVYHRGIGVCRPLFVAASATPATFPAVVDAVPAALTAEASTSARVGPYSGTS